MSYKSRGNWCIGTCIKDCANKDYYCDVCVKFSEFLPAGESPRRLSDESISSLTPSSVSKTPEYVVNKQGEHYNLSSYQKNGIYRLARDLRDNIKDSLCSKSECREPTDHNVKKMILSEFKAKKKIREFKDRMKAIGADEKDYCIDRLRRR